MTRLKKMTIGALASLMLFAAPVAAAAGNGRMAGSQGTASAVCTQADCTQDNCNDSTGSQNGAQTGSQNGSGVCTNENCDTQNCTGTCDGTGSQNGAQTGAQDGSGLHHGNGSCRR